jgi:hypothetical protein
VVLGEKVKNPGKFYENLEINIRKGKPTRAFLWPEDVTEHDGAAFGYIMDLRPPSIRIFPNSLSVKKPLPA